MLTANRVTALHFDLSNQVTLSNKRRSKHFLSASLNWKAAPYEFLNWRRNKQVFGITCYRKMVRVKYTYMSRDVALY